MAHILIVEAPYYEEIAGMLRQGAMQVLNASGATYETISVAGALEIPPAIAIAAQRKDTARPMDQFDAYIALGCVIRGATSHYDIVCEQSAAGIMRLSLDQQLPIGNGILTCDSQQQAIERADPKQKDRGGHAAHAALNLLEIKGKYRG